MAGFFQCAEKKEKKKISVTRTDKEFSFGLGLVPVIG